MIDQLCDGLNSVCFGHLSKNNLSVYWFQDKVTLLCPMISSICCDATIANSQDSLATFNFLKQYIEGLDNDGMCMHKNFNFLADIF